MREESFLSSPSVLVRARRELILLLTVGLVAGACGNGSSGEIDPPPTSEFGQPATPSGSEGDQAPERFDPGSVRLELRTVVGGLEAPLQVTSAGDGSDRLFVVEQGGRIHVIEDGQLQASPFLDISDRLVAGGEQGLLGLAFHPEFESNGRLFVNYTDLAGDTVIAEYRVPPGDPAHAGVSSERVLLRVDQPFANHNGGGLAFGPDGFLYIAMGDGGSAGDPMGNGQRLDTLLGKLLRIDVDEARDGRPYGIPADNPFVGREGPRAEIWAYGLRNPWRFSFDRATGDLWIGDVGQSDFEEIDRVAGDEPGLNFGWNVMEGRACFEPSSGCEDPELVLPVAVYDHELGCSVTGGFVYRGSRWPALAGAYLFADYCSGTIWGLGARRPRERAAAVLLESGRAISSFGEDEDGEVYVTDLAGGEVLRIEAPAR